MSEGEVTAHWGKLTRAADGKVIEWHPLAAHCADVAAVTRALLRMPTWRRRLATLAECDDLDDPTCDRLSALAALHDLGKFNHGFQNKAFAREPLAGHVTEALALLEDPDDVCRFMDALGWRDFDAWGAGATTLLQSAICHHGRPHGREAPDHRRHLWADGAGHSPLDGVRALGHLIRGWLPRAFTDSVSPLSDLPAFSHAFAGLVMLADWIGSDTRAFRYLAAGERSEDRFGWASLQADELLISMGIATERGRSQLEGREPFDAVSDAESPRPAQRAIGQLPLPTAGSVVILEAETGSGKTEAALMHFVRLYAAGEVDGLYFALPTRTAATQIHSRLCAAIQRAFGLDDAPAVVLAVPGYLDVDGVQGQRLPGFETLWPDERRFRFRAWAAEHPKRYFAGPILVGTIDQVLLSGLAVDHAHLRATALLRHLLIVDEVHASDAYMTRVLTSVLARQRQAGGHALLLSATLGGEARAKLLGGDRLRSPTFAAAKAAPYPAISAPHVADTISVGNPADAGKFVRVELRPLAERADEIVAQALEAARRGAKVVVLRNTVADCVATQRALERAAGTDAGRSLFGLSGVAAPHHSRYARPDRVALDEAVEAAFGKTRPVGGRVLVATQTIQQSLDLDVDLLLTDLCPMDVLLQRIGRLHRHRRDRPAGFEQACCVVLTPSGRDLGLLIRRDGKASNHHGLGSVYDDLCVVEATWRALEARPSFEIPRDARALVEESLHSSPLADIVREGCDAWRRHAQAVAGASRGDQQVAALNVVDWHGTRYPHCAYPTDGRRVASRLGESDRLVRLPRPCTSPFGRTMTEFVIPGWLCRDAPPDETSARDVVSAGESSIFSFGAKRYRYDRLGLRAEEPALEESDEQDDA